MKCKQKISNNRIHFHNTPRAQTEIGVAHMRETIFPLPMKKLVEKCH
jgi:hypothetical protein